MAAVWNKALSIPGYDLRLWRRDACGAPILAQTMVKPLKLVGKLITSTLSQTAGATTWQTYRRYSGKIIDLKQIN